MADELQIVTVPERDVVAVPQPDIQTLVAEQPVPVVIEQPQTEVVTTDNTISVVEVVPEVHVVSEGQVGPKGAKGDSVTAVTKVAATVLNGNRVVTLDASGEAIFADSSTLAHRDKVLGITTGAAVLGGDATIQTYGELTEPSWAWTAGEPVYLGLTGLLTQTPPTTGFLQRMGFAVVATKLFIDIDSPITF